MDQVGGVTTPAKKNKISTYLNEMSLPPPPSPTDPPPSQRPPSNTNTGGTGELPLTQSLTHLSLSTPPPSLKPSSLNPPPSQRPPSNTNTGGAGELPLTQSLNPPSHSTPPSSLTTSTIGSSQPEIFINKKSKQKMTPRLRRIHHHQAQAPQTTPPLPARHPGVRGGAQAPLQSTPRARSPPSTTPRPETGRKRPREKPEIRTELGKIKRKIQEHPPSQPPLTTGPPSPTSPEPRRRSRGSLPAPSSPPTSEKNE